MAPAAAVSPTDTGRFGRAQKTPPAPDPLRPCVTPVSGIGVLCGTANAGAATPTVRMAADAAPPSKMRQLNTGTLHFGKRQ